MLCVLEQYVYKSMQRMYLHAQYIYIYCKAVIYAFMFQISIVGGAYSFR